MKEFFKDVEDIKSDINAVREATRQIGTLNESAYMASSAQQEEGDRMHEVLF